MLAALVAASALLVAACTGGGGTTSTGGVYFTHAELAKEFVYRLNVDKGYDVELVKTNTLQYDYIVVYDYDFGTYDAYYIGSYNVGENLTNYLKNNSYRFSYDLVNNFDGTYYDPDTGKTFEKTQATPKDRMKLAAIKEGLLVAKASKTLQAEFGLSAQRSQELAKLTIMLKNSPKESMTDADYDRYSTAAFGASISEFKAATFKAMAGSKSELNSLIENAAVMNGVTPEDANNIVSKYFGMSLN